MQEAEERARRENMLVFRIPEAPYSDEALERVHEGLELTDGAFATLEIFASDFVALGAIGGVALVGPVAGWLASLIAPALGYAGSRAKAAREEIKTGFAEGIVAGADGNTFALVRSLFGEGEAESNAFDPSTGRIAQQAHNFGLMSGFIQGSRLSEMQKKFLWQSILTDLDRTATPGVDPLARFRAARKPWSESQWGDYYLFMAKSFLKLYASD
jgi:hypothetical protein